VVVVKADEWWSSVFVERRKMTGLETDRAALVISHPGHELCVHGWLETARPDVFVLTDGSGRSGMSRLQSTTKILSHVGARPASIYGHLTDATIYTAILQRDFGLFERLVVELAQALVRAEIDYVAGDAKEGYNPIHDTWRLVVDAAVEIASARRGRRIVNRDFLLFGRHDSHPEELRASAIWRVLDDDAFARKLSAARAHPELRSEVEALVDKKMIESLQAFPEVSAQLHHLVDAMGGDAYRVECLRLVNSPARANSVAEVVPFYEQYGERLVAAGVYRQAIRYREHIVPLSDAIARVVDASH
jgi:hypothetical protein